MNWSIKLISLGFLLSSFFAFSLVSIAFAVSGRKGGFQQNRSPSDFSEYPSSSN